MLQYIFHKKIYPRHLNKSLTQIPFPRFSYFSFFNHNFHDLQNLLFLPVENLSINNATIVAQLHALPCLVLRSVDWEVMKAPM